MLRYIIFAVAMFSGNLLANDLKLDAEEIIFQSDETIIAKGNINASYIAHQLNSNFLEYNKKSGNIVAKGDVRYVNEDTQLSFLSSEINSNFDFTIMDVSNVRAKLEDNSYIQAKQLSKTDDKYNIIKGTYTSCKLCKNGKVKIPQWEIYASKALYDETKQNIYFTNAFLKIYKVPVLYFPKFILPGPKVKKRTGLLPIKYASDSVLGTQWSVPIFLNLAPNYDLTYTPTIFSKQNIFHTAEIRYMNESSVANLAGGYVKENQEFIDARGIDITREDRDKWYLDLDYLFNTKNFSFEGDIFDSSGRAILERYKYDFQQYYNSDINVNHVSDDKFFLLNVGKFYDFVNNDKSYELPHISYKATTELRSKIFYTYNLDYVYLSSPDKIHRQRLFYKDSLYKEFITKNGLLLKAQLDNTLRSYYNDNASTNYDSFSHYTAKLGLNVEKPYLKPGKKVNYVVTPKASMILAPNNTNSNKITNLDSSTTYLNYTNLLAVNKNAGSDLLEEGSRFNYGMLKGLYNQDITLENFIGQSYYVKNQNNISRSSGIKKEFSDIVGNLKFSYDNYLNFEYNYKLEETNMTPYHKQIILGLNFDKISFYNSYTKYKYSILDPLSLPLEQLYSSISYKSKDKFNLTASTTRNMLDESIDPNSGSVTSAINLEIYGHCVTYLINISKDYFTTEYVKPDLKFSFGFQIKGF